MSDSRGSANIFGWLALIAVVGLIGAGWLYQREGGSIFGEREPIPEPKAPQRKPPAEPTSNDKTRAGENPKTQDKSPKAADKYNLAQVNIGLTGAYVHPEGAIRIYVDGKLVSLPLNSNLLLTSMDAGPHFVEVGYATNKKIPPLEFKGQHIHPKAGETIAITFDVPSPGSRPEYPPEEAVSRDREQYAKYLADLNAKVNRETKAYNDDLLYLELANIHARFRNAPPRKRVVHARLPTIHGGPREIDAEQVRILVGWLNFYYTGWYSEIVELFAPPELQNQAKDLGATVRRNRERTFELKAIAVALEKATN